MTRDKQIIVLDGHDGAGKTTLGRMIAAELGGEMVRPFADTLGDFIAWSYRRKDFLTADQVARLAVDRIMDAHNSHTLVFDRHWLCMFTVLPPQFWAAWHPLPFTILCWCDLETTLTRLTERGEDASDVALHEYYCRYYPEIATRFQVPILDTSIDPLSVNFQRCLSLIREGARL